MMTVMPMFPLSSVLFPSMPLTLRIFEERYLKLLGDLMTTDTPEFGVPLVARGTEIDGGDNRMSVGTIATVTEIGTTDEFFGLESFGSRRFMVREWLPDDPYPVAEIEYLPDLVWDENLVPARVHLESAVRQLLTLASEFGNLVFGPDIELSVDPMGAVWQLAGIVPVGELDRFDMLCSQSAEELISRAYSITSEAQTVLRAMTSGGSEHPPE
jgi:Lon protease-like protein